MPDPKLQEGVFDDCSIAIVRSQSLTEESARDLVKQIELHGGNAFLDDYPENPLKIEDATHIIAEDSDFPDYFEALDHFIPVVRSSWIASSIATKKLSHPRKFSPDPKLFLSDVVATCADLPIGDKEAIAGGILAMGGNYTPKLTAQVTHIVALSIDNDKADQVLKNHLKMKIVLPHWFDDCLKLGKKIDEGPYMLPEPEYLQAVENSVVPGRPSKHLSGATSATPAMADPPKLSGRKGLNVFKNKKILLDADLQIGEVLRNVLQGMILASKGFVVDNVAEANILVCKYRDGSNYRTATIKKIDVGNLSWLYYLIVHDIWTSPFKRLLHYPLPREPLPGFEKLKISMSNYTGEARTFLENLINATGAESTKTLKQDNTHLITAHRKSEKVEAAEGWGVQVVNHLWLEESFEKWQLQAVTSPRYNHFPRRTNLGDVVGQTQIDRTVIENVFLGQKFAVPTIPSTRRRARPETEATDANTNTPTKTGHGTESHGKSKPVETPLTSRKQHDLESSPPTSVTSRRSKDAATARLSNLTADIALYEKERKRVGGVVYGGRRKDDSERADAGRKRSAEPAEIEEVDLEPQKASKKQKTGPAPIEVHLLISGYTAWVGKAKKEDDEIKKLRALGIAVVDHPSKASHVAVPKIVRTPKFLLALAHGLPILSTDYIEACLEAEECLEPDGYKLIDKESETRFGMSLPKALKNAKANKQELLKGYTMYCTEKIPGGFDTYRHIAEANGTNLVPYRGRAMTIPSRRAGSDDEDVNNEIFLLTTDTAEEKRLWPKFVKMAEDSRWTPHILQGEWLLRTALRQEIEPLAKHEMNV